MADLKSTVKGLRAEFRKTSRLAKSAQAKAERQLQVVEKQARERILAAEELAYKRFEDLSRFLLSLELDQFNQLSALRDKFVAAGKKLKR